MTNISNNNLVYLACLCTAMFYSSTARAVDPALDWQTIESKHFLVHFNKPQQTIAEHVLAIAERVHTRLSKELNWTPLDKTHLVLSDESDYANGYATVFNINRSVLFLAPPTGLTGLEDFDNWLELLITHEYTHVLHLDKVAGAPKNMRKVFGRFLLLFPNVFEPGWVVEGLATYKESDFERGIGRGQSSLYQMLMRMEVAQGIKPLSQVNLPISSWPSGATRYLYGVYFMRFISERYGDHRLQLFIEAYSDNLIPFYLNTTLKQIYNKDGEALWQEYAQWLDEKFQPQIAALSQQASEDQAIPVTRSGYFTGPVRAVGKTLYYISNDGSHQPALIQQSANGDIETLAEVHGNAGFDVNAHGSIVISQPEVCDEYSLYSDLYIYKSGELKRITKCGRYQRAVWSADGEHLFAVHHAAGVFELHELDTEGKAIQTLWTSSDAAIVSQIDAAPDGKHLVAAIWRKIYGWNLEVFDIASGSWTALTQNNEIQAYPEYSADGNSIFYSADSDGVFNLYRYDIATQSHHQLSHLLGGGFQVSQGMRDGPLYYIGYSARGTDVYKLENSMPSKQVELHKTEALNANIYTPMTATSREYSPWSSMRPRWWLPYIFKDEQRSEFGATTAGNDALSIHNYTLSAAYDFENSLPLGSMSYQYSNKFAASISRDNNFYKNTSGVTDRIRADETLQLIYAIPDTKILSASNFLLALSWERDRDVELRAGATPIGEFNDNLAGLAWLYNNAKRYPLSISANDGRRIRLVAEDSDVFNSDFSGEIYTLDWREFISLGGEHVLSLRALQAWGTEQPSRFRLGGENSGHNLSLFSGASGEPVFARREYALRGYDEGLPQLRGRRVQMVSTEYRFPIQRVERGIMAPPVGLMQWYGSVFVDSGAAYDGRRPDKYYTGAGVEFSADLNLFYLVPLTTRLGYAHGFDVIGDNRVYLTVGASF